MQVILRVGKLAARGHIAYTDLSAAGVRGQNAQAAALSRQVAHMQSSSLTPFVHACLGASPNKPREISVGFLADSALVGVSEVATTVDASTQQS